MTKDFFSWLHLTDFHYGLKGQDCLWPTLRQPFLESLGTLHERCGPWQAVLFTGDLVQSGQPEQFQEMQDEVLEPLWERLRELGSGDAVLLAVPGNHDLQRPDPNGNNAAVDWLLENDFQSIAAKFWDNPASPYRRVVHDAFGAYDQWWGTAPHRPDRLTAGTLPGDFSTTLEQGERRIGIVGLNTTFLQLAGGDYEGRLVWDARQLHAVCEGGVDVWSKRHDVALLLTHQGPNWLTAEARRHGESEIAPAGRFAVHLFGHQHETDITYISRGGGLNPVRLCQGCSVFGMETFGDPPIIQRTHGYAAGRIDFGGEQTTLRLWPRIASRGTGAWRFIPDHANAVLQGDEGTEADPVGARLRTPSAPPVTPDLVQPAMAEAAHPQVPPKRTVGLYGRGTLLTEAVTKLTRSPFLLVYGLRGIGKTALIEALAEQAPLAEKEPLRLVVNTTTTADELFRQLAPLLSETAEFPKAPQGTVQAIATEIRTRYPTPRPAWIWLDRAHNLLDGAGFRHTGVRSLLLGLQTAIGTPWNWVLEFRERPPHGLLGTAATECEVLGLNKNSLGECIADAAPVGRADAWRYAGQQLKRIYGWLGGGRGDHAHPQATQLLIEVARARNETPLEVLERHIDDWEQRIEDVLLADLYDNVLSQPERRLLDALALYRAGIPHDHAEALERLLELSDAWDGLDRRCLLAPSKDHHHYYLHSFISGWVRTRQLGYAGYGEDDDADFTETTDEATRQLARELHSAIATCWLDQLRGSRRPTNVNISRALEAFYHLVAAGDADRVQEVAVDLLNGNLEWARKQMKEFQEKLFRTSAPLSQQLAALQYRAVLDPDDHAVQRFLGECWQKVEGTTSGEALRCFETACRLRPDFPPYLANFGKTLLAQGRDGAARFLAHLKSLEADYPEAINPHVRAIQSDCVQRIGGAGEASVLRMVEIDAGSRDAVFYHDEAKARVDAGNLTGALEILNLAERRGCADDFIKAIRARILQQTDPAAASALRMTEIEAGSHHSAFYHDEAKARLDAGNIEGALEVLDLAEERGASTDITKAIRGSILQQTNPAAASALRMAEIEASSHHPAFYNDEAKARLDAGNLDGALQVLDLAERRGCTDNYTPAIRRSVLKRLE